MKRHTLIYLFLCLTIVCAFAAQAQRSFRFHKSDGNMQSFFYSALDSITFSNIDLDGVSHDAVVVQEFHTPDSIYRIPLAEIDSVAFTTPPTVYKPGAVKIEGELRQYVLRADSLTLWLQAATPENIIPRQGDNIVTLDCDEILPYGFIGKVESVERKDGSVAVDCSQAALTDIFERLYLEVDADTPDESERSQKRALAPDSEPVPDPVEPDDTGESIVWPPRQFEISIPSISHSYSLSKEILSSGSGALTGEYHQSADLSLSTKSFNVRLGFFIDGPNVSFSLNAIGEHNATLTSSFGGSLGFEKEIPFKVFRNQRVPGAAGILEFFEEAGIYIGVKGTIGLNAVISKDFKSILHVEYCNTMAGNIPNQLSFYGGKTDLDLDIEGEAEVNVGVYLKIGVAPIAKEVANIAPKIKAGVTVSAEQSVFTWAPSAGSIDKRDTSLYNEINHDDYIKADFVVAGGVDIKLLDSNALPTINFSREIQIGSLGVTNPFWMRGAVPEFSNVKLTPAEEAGSFTATADLSRKLILPARVGFALYDSDKTLLKKWWADEKYKNEELRSISHEFKYLSKCEEYTVCPIVDALGREMAAGPMSKARAKFRIFTVGHDDVTVSSVSVMGSVEGYDKKEACQVGVELTDHKSSAYKVFYGKFDVESGKFSVVATGLDEGTEYSYRTFYKTKTKTSYGEFKEFKTRPSSVSVNVITLKPDSYAPPTVDVEIICLKGILEVEGHIYHHRAGFEVMTYDGSFHQIYEADWFYTDSLRKKASFSYEFKNPMDNRRYKYRAFYRKEEKIDYNEDDETYYGEFVEFEAVSKSDR